MPTKADARQLVTANGKIKTFAEREFMAIWNTLDLWDAALVKRVMLTELPDIVAKYGDLAATVAADLYEEWRSSVASGWFTADLAEPAAAGQVQASIRYSLGSLYGSTPDFAAVRELLSGDVVDRYVGNQGRETFALNGKRDKASARWARIPIGETCEWCTMLGSRGAVYYADATAEAASHGRCDCIVLPEFEDGDLPDDYDPDALYDQWQAMKVERESQTTPN